MGSCRRRWTTMPALLTLAAIGCIADDAPPADPAEAPAGTEAGTTGDETSATSGATPVVVASGLNGPIGVLVEEDGTIWVADSGTGGTNRFMGSYPGYDEPVTFPYGTTARVVRIDPDGRQSDVVMLPSIVIPEGPQGAGRMVLMDGVLHVTSAGWGGEMAEALEDRIPHAAAVVRVEDGTATEYVNTWDFEERENPDPARLETNPFDLTVGPDGALWLTDAAGNTLLRVDPETDDLELVAVFDVWEGPIPNAGRGGAMEVEPVPTAVAFDGDDNVYVSLLGGFPFIPGSSKVVQVSPDGEVTDYATGLTMIADLVTGPDGSLYAVSFGEFGEEGPTPGRGAVLRIGPGTTSQVLVSGLSFPASVAFTSDGDAYVTVNALGEPGSGEVLKFERLTAME